jgi:hypothetical protein
MALAMFPDPMMLMLLMTYPVLLVERLMTQPYANIGDASTKPGSMETDENELAERS